MLGNMWLALGVTLVLSILWLRFNDFLAHRGLISGPLSRKIIHTGTGPIFVLCWLLFPDHPLSRYAAAFVPFAITAQFFLIGTGIVKDQASVDAMSRHGERREILRGPLFYGIVFVIMTIVYWYESPIGLVALMLLCGGDGLADIIGKRVVSPKLPWSKNKSTAGTIGMWLGGWAFSLLVLWIFTAANVIPQDLAHYFWPVTMITIAGTLVETLPFEDIDNLTVPGIAVLLGHLLLG